MIVHIIIIGQCDHFTTLQTNVSIFSMFMVGQAKLGCEIDQVYRICFLAMVYMNLSLLECKLIIKGGMLTCDHMTIISSSLEKQRMNKVDG